jgi:hypothetical protein
VTDVAAVAASTVNATAECFSGEVKAGGCALLVAGAAVEGVSASVGTSLEANDILQGAKLGRAEVARGALTYAIASQDLPRPRDC